MFRLVGFFHFKSLLGGEDALVIMVHPREASGLHTVDPAVLRSGGNSANVFTCSGSASGGQGQSCVFEYGICSSGSGENPAAVNPGTSSLG